MKNWVETEAALAIKVKKCERQHWSQQCPNTDNSLNKCHTPKHSNTKKKNSCGKLMPQGVAEE